MGGGHATLVALVALVALMVGSRLARVVALVPHFGNHVAANEWLRQGLRSLATQSTALDATVVVDDCSPFPPDEVVRGFPGVTLLRPAHNAGCFALFDRVAESLSCDALLLQDSDDWSLPDRLERLREAMERRSLDIVGSQVRTIFQDLPPDDEFTLRQMPSDPRQALLSGELLHPLLLPTALLRLSFVRRLGGFASGFRLGGDSEFVRRAVLGGTARNLQAVLYVRRVHSASLTRSPDTGMGSPARVEEQRILQARGRDLINAVVAGQAPDLSPLARSPRVDLQHVLGPPPPFH